MLTFEGLYFKYSKNAPEDILKNISFSASNSEICAIMGPNGSGKSTLLKCAAGVIKPCRGAMRYRDECLFSNDKTNRARIIAYMPQTQNPPACSVFDAVLLGRKPHITFSASKKDIKKVEDIINAVGIANIAMKRCDELSGGELQKTVFARALAQEPQILLLDEPTNHLDLKNQIEVMKLIRRLTEELKIITIAVIHDINLALKFSGSFVLIKDGQIFANSDISAITKQNIDALYSVDSKIYDIDGGRVVTIN